MPVHSCKFDELPSIVKEEFGPAIEKRKSKSEKFSTYAYVNSRHGKRGYFSDFTVERTRPREKAFNLGRVVDQKLGAFLTCAHFVDEKVKNREDARQLLEMLTTDEEATKAWIERVRINIPCIKATKGGSYTPTLKRKREEEGDKDAIKCLVLILKEKNGEIVGAFPKKTAVND